MSQHSGRQAVSGIDIYAKAREVLFFVLQQSPKTILLTDRLVCLPIFDMVLSSEGVDYVTRQNWGRYLRR